MSKETLHTKFGIARLDKKKGYYKVHQKLLHRLIYEDYHKVTLLSTTDIHHIDGNKTNNDISNLQALTHGQHSRLHELSEESIAKIRQATSGKNNPFYGKKHTDESKQKMREAKLGKPHSFKHRKNSAKTRSSTGIMYVRKQWSNKLKQRFSWVYDNKNVLLSSVDLVELKDRVESNNLEWIILDEGKAKDSFDENKDIRTKYPHKWMVSEETKEHLRQINLGKKHSEDTKRKMSKLRNTAGVYHVSKENDKRYSQGFRWKYSYIDKNGKEKKISSTDINKLKKKVIEKGLEWIEY